MTDPKILSEMDKSIDDLKRIETQLSTYAFNPEIVTMRTKPVLQMLAVAAEYLYANIAIIRKRYVEKG